MQAAPRPSSSWQKEHLWMSLQALGFDPGTEAAAAGKSLAHVTFGVNMFDRPNKDAFYVVFHFLFGKLDNARCEEVFRYCWPHMDKKRDAEFRKACCEWLRKISEDAGSGFPQVVASVFLSPGGPKFVHLSYHFARFVLLQHIKKDVDGANSYMPEALQARVQDPQKALIRNKVARRRYLQMLQRENFVIGEYQKKAQLLVKQIRDLRSECAALQNQQKMVENSSTDQTERRSNIEQIRSMWNTIMQTLKSIEKEVEVVDCVVRGNVYQYYLDGSKVSLTIPNILVTRIESEMHKLQMENVYEAGKVNLVTIFQLLNEALKIVKRERCQYDKGLPLDLQYLTGKAKFETDILTRLQTMRHKIKREDLVSINKSIADKEHEWEKKWRKVLGKSPFDIFKVLNPVLNLQPPMAPFSFEPATDEVLRNSVFYQYPPSAQDQHSTDSKDLNRESGQLRRSFMESTVLTPSGRNSLPLLCQTPTLKRRMSLNEKDFRTPTPNAKDSFLERTPSSALNKRRSDTSWKTNAGSLLHTPTPCKADPMSTARQQLAQQVAEFIASDSPRTLGGRGVELDDLIGMLSSDPFLSRKEIPRTPENLISDIRTSWRKAIQSEESSDVVASPLEPPCLDSPAEMDSAQCSQIDLSMACFMSTSHVSDLHNESVETTRIISNPGTSVPSQSTGSEMNTMGLEEFLIPIKESGTLHSSFVDRNQTFVLDKEPVRILDNPLVLSVPRNENASAHSTLSWDSSKMVDYSNSLDASEVIQLGILHETLPDRVGNISLNSTDSPETRDIINSQLNETDCILDTTEGSFKSLERKTDIHSIRSRYEALKTTLFTSLMDSGKGDKHTPTRFSKQKSESSLTLDAGSVFSPAEKGLTLDVEYLMTPSPKDRKLSLPQLISFSPAEELVHVGKDDLGDVFETQGAVNLNETFEFATDPLKCTDEGLGQLITL
ncbi:HAUS augmin-like complex subunit 6 [Spea bombifrons]|uniref:HAUS augmin-like complex subunit 6 n=1 Tax=Spea bombifrons TaxID=233779 RepID=UPI002349476F|nr:HAUS augmin-like complex subunit 6 [Spea bombifrons]